MKKHTVYILTRIDGARYVGSTLNLSKRLSVHFSVAGKFYNTQASVESIHCATEQEMQETEMRLIRELRPELNTQHSSLRDYSHRVDQLRSTGASWRSIGRQLGIDGKTAKKASTIHAEHCACKGGGK